MRLVGAAVAAAAVTAAMASPAAAAIVPAKGTYTGSSKQLRIADHSVNVRVDKQHRVVHFDIGWRAKCERPDRYWTAGTKINNPTNEANGVFHDHGPYTTTTDDGKFRARITITLNGHFTDSTHAQGTWKVAMKVFRVSTGKQIDTCALTTGWHVAP